MIRIIFLLLTVFAFLLLASLLIPKARWQFLYFLKSSYKDLWEIVVDFTPGKGKKVRIWEFLLMLLLMPLVAVFFGIIILVFMPAVSLFHAIKHPEKIDELIEFDKELKAPRPIKPKKTPEEIAEENRMWQERMMAIRFTVERKDLPYDPDEKEIFFYTPEDAPEVENAIRDHYDEIKYTFEKKGYSFVFLPFFNKELNILLNADRIKYYSPKANNLLRMPIEAISYQDIRDALRIPNKVDGPCFIRCKDKDHDPLVFSFWKIEILNGDIMAAVDDYLNNVGESVVFYHKVSDEYLRQSLEGESADDRFDDDIYLIGKEIKDRIAQLRSKGLSTLAIRKLIGDDTDKPGKLLIDKHNKLFLTDFGNKEIKLEPLQKTVFFLFLRHPEGICFKDLGDYREELSSIYREITGRDDLAGIQDSIDKLTDPFNNSINEKCARIKNAFVSEFREEVAQWYFIDGNRGEKKSIKLPRELVTWEIKN